MNKEKLENAKNLFFIALGIDIFVTGMVAISDFWAAGILKDISAGISTVADSTINTLEFWDSFAKVMILTLIGVGLGLVKWLNTCYQYAKESVGAVDFRNDGWTAAGWIIPVFNLFKPYQVIDEIYKAGAPVYSMPDGWKGEKGSTLLLIWWIFYALTHFIGTVVSRQIFMSSLRDDKTLQQSIDLIEFQAWYCLMSLIIAGVWFAIAGGLTRRLLERPCLTGRSISLVADETVNTVAPPINPSTFSTLQTSRVVPDAALGKEEQVAPKNIPSSIEDNDEDEIYALIAEELDTGTMDKGLWTRLFAECDGDEKRVKVLYITRRFKKLKGAEKAQNKLNSQEAERIEQEALRVSMGEEALRQTAGIAGLTLPDAILNEAGTVPSAILGSSAHDIDINAKGISVPDLEKMRGDEQIVRLLHDFSIKSPGDDNVGPSMDNEKVSEAVKNFQSGKTPTNEEVNFLVQAALKNPSIAKISDQLHNNTLLHWCAKLSLSREASILIRLQADAKAFNSAGQQAHQLAKNLDFRTMLAAAANGEKVA